MVTGRFLETERTYLRALKSSDIDGPYVDWLNDPDVCFGNSHHVFPYTREKGLNYIRAVNEASDSLVLAVLLKDGDLHIGNISLQKIDRLYNKAEFAILMGDKVHWGSGFAFESSEALFAHGFKSLNLLRIECATFEQNVGMVALARKLGMQQEGLRRRAAYKDGEYVNVLEYGILREEFSRGDRSKVKPHG